MTDETRAKDSAGIAVTQSQYDALLRSVARLADAVEAERTRCAAIARAAGREDIAAEIEKCS